MHWRLKFFILLFTVFSAQAAYVVNNSGKKIRGSKIEITADGTVSLLGMSGQKMIFYRGKYRQAVADKPVEFKQAQKAIKNQKIEEAINLLKQVKLEYRFLFWDQKATELLAHIFYNQGNFKAAAAEFQCLEDLSRADEIFFRKSLLKSGQFKRLSKILEDDLHSDLREKVAWAYLLRGDLKELKGDLNGARRDWLKVATFFRRQAELVKLANEKLGDEEGCLKEKIE
jgi:tetratricopeptide (TPR) repeat protein